MIRIEIRTCFAVEGIPFPSLSGITRAGVLESLGLRPERSYHLGSVVEKVGKACVIEQVFSVRPRAKHRLRHTSQ